MQLKIALIKVYMRICNCALNLSLKFHELDSWEASTTKWVI